MPNPYNDETGNTPSREPVGTEDECQYQTVGGKDLKFTTLANTGEKQPIAIKETSGLPITPIEKVIPDA